MDNTREIWKTHYHITIDPNTNVDEFNAKAKKLGLKPTVISMLRGGFETKDLMFTVYQKDNSLDRMYQNVGRITLEGLKVIRVKMEEQFKKPEDTLGLDLSDGKYLEFHLKVFKTTTSRMLDNKVDVLLSSNPREDAFDIISLRAYNPSEAEKIIDYIKRKKSFISEVHSEQIVMDTNPNVDEGWVPLTEAVLNPKMVYRGAICGELMDSDGSSMIFVTEDLEESLPDLDTVQKMKEFDNKVRDMYFDGKFEEYTTDEIYHYYPIYFQHSEMDTLEFKKTIDKFFETGKLPFNWKMITDYETIKFTDGYKWFGAISKVMEISGSESPMDIKGNNGYLIELDSISQAEEFLQRVDDDFYEDTEEDWSTDRLEAYFIKAPSSMNSDEIVDKFDRFLVFEEKNNECVVYSDIEKVKEDW
ncbi:hypothetical protein [Proteus mirabilis]|uniref:hypothetical protein n=1 Tax=Proteus mirabilis TaxID=584 RepID=UPI0034D5BEBF